MALQYGRSPAENLLQRPDMSQRGLRGPWLILVHIVGSGIGILTLLLFVIGLPLQASHLHLICTTVVCQGTETSSEVAQQLHSLGLSLTFYTIYSLTLQVILAFTYFLVAGIIVWRRSDDWMALLGTIFMVTFVVVFTDVPHTLAEAYPSLNLLMKSIELSAKLIFPLFFYLFPNGRFVPLFPQGFSVYRFCRESAPSSNCKASWG